MGVNRKQRRAARAKRMGCPEAATTTPDLAGLLDLRFMPRCPNPASRVAVIACQEPRIFARALDLVTGRDPLACAAALSRLVGRLLEAEAADRGEKHRDALYDLACQTVRAGMRAAEEERAELAK